MEPIYVSTGTELEQAVSRCADSSVIALDTEFARFNTYYPMVGLVQIATQQHCFLSKNIVVSLVIN